MRRWKGLLAAGGLLLVAASGALAQLAPILPDKPALHRLEGALAQQAAKRPGAAVPTTGSLPKLASALQEIAADEIEGFAFGSSRDITQLQVDDIGRVLVSARVLCPLDEIRRDLAPLGFAESVSDADLAVIEGYAPLASLVTMANLPCIRAISEIYRPQVNAGSVTSQGDHQMRGDLARALGVNGAGVKVGVISDSINMVGSGVAGSQALGDLPSNVTVLAEGPVGSKDEGRAMSEIIYDTAPGIAGIWFSSGGQVP